MRPDRFLLFPFLLPLEKDGNLSIPLYVPAATTQNCEENSASQATALPEALTAWLKSSADVGVALDKLLSGAST